LTEKEIESGGERRKKREKGEKVTERKMGNKHLLEAYKAIFKGGKSEKSAGKKDRKYAFIESCEVYLNMR
jgi:hypothetical protein